uniref:Cytochrome b n=1 Tax=Saccostrea cuccullata TaxID=36930 RepID=A0A344PFP7_9BIVA|nr:cytochrome b [Saccostrea malabonensis]AXC47871.1 cytochrome b [Saccostrea cucullata]AXC47883.1 cytochrome b [Saccostrea cucullata]USM11336.1 cytochrome b [Saccostrea malabonensis]
MKYPCPSNLNIWWNMGSMLFVTLAIQILSGIMLSMNYTADGNLATESMSYILRDANYGWALRSTHMAGASLFFALIYIHVGRGVYYGSYMKLPHVWYSGVTLYLLSMGVGFLGYVLPWGVMSYWGLTVITNMMTVFPGGARALEWFQGGFTISTFTLKRVFVLHFLLPFVVLGMSVAHVLLLHNNGSSNPLGLDTTELVVPFHPYYTSKDLVGFVFMLAGLAALAFTFPKITADPLQWQTINKMKTPAVIKPEWYFLYAYAILRSVPHKAGGLALMFAAILGIALLPTLGKYAKTQSMVMSPLGEALFFIWVANFMFLGIIGSQEPAGAWILAGQVGTFVHLFCMLSIPAANAKWEKMLFNGYGRWVQI